jgi:uncharacterized protein YlxW (UPF0749 family)
MSNTVIDLEGSKLMLSALFELEISKITETIRRESNDDKDKRILLLEAQVSDLKKENNKLSARLNDVKNLVGRA